MAALERQAFDRQAGELPPPGDGAQTITELTAADKAVSACVVLTSMEVRTAKAYEAFLLAARQRFPICRELSLAELPDGVMPAGYRDHHRLFLLCGGEAGLRAWDNMVKPKYRRSRKDKRADQQHLAPRRGKDCAADCAVATE